MSASEVLIEQFLDGSLSSFDELISIHEKEIFNVVSCVVDEPALAEDVASRVFLRLVDDAGSPQVRADVRGHLLRSAWTEIRAAKFEQTLNQESLAEEIETATAAAPRGLAGLRELIAKMPSEVAMAFVLRQVSGLSLDSTAEILEISEERAIARLTTAFRILRKAKASGGVLTQTGRGQNCSVQQSEEGTKDFVV